MSLDQAQGIDSNSSPLDRLFNQVSLRTNVRRGQGIRMAAVILHTAHDDTLNGITIALGLCQGLEQNRTHTFPTHITIGSSTEGMAMSARAHHPCLLQSLVRVWV